jgi:hypothetical protein
MIVLDLYSELAFGFSVRSLCLAEAEGCLRGENAF